MKRALNGPGVPGVSGQTRAPGSSRFRFHLTLLLLTILPALGLAGTQQAREQAVLLARGVAAKQERRLDNTRQVLAALAALAAIHNATNSQFWSGNFKNMLSLQPQSINVGMLETDGGLFASALRLETSRAGGTQCTLAFAAETVGLERACP